MNVNNSAATLIAEGRCDEAIRDLAKSLKELQQMMATEVCIPCDNTDQRLHQYIIESAKLNQNVMKTILGSKCNLIHYCLFI